MQEYQYELKNPFEYAVKTGDIQTAGFISMTAPGYKQVSKVTPIKQAFMAAIAEVTESLTDDIDEDTIKAAKSEEGVTSQQVIQIMYRWSGDMTKIFLHAAELFKSGVALVDGETPLNAPLIDKMSMSDFEGLLGAYVANFIAPSLMDGQ